VDLENLVFASDNSIGEVACVVMPGYNVRSYLRSLEDLEYLSNEVKKSSRPGGFIVITAGAIWHAMNEDYERLW
jgi:NifB/MoaA-like Fe-S oxidoreductase